MVKVRLKDRVIWDFLARNNLSQSELAHDLGTSSGYISQLICGTRCPSPKLRRKMLEVFNPLTFDDLFTIEEKK